MQEIWKAIPGYEGLYEVSNLGEVRRVFTKTKLSAADTEYLQQALNQGVRQKVLAKQFGVSRQAIWALRKNVRYSQKLPHLVKNSVTRDGYYRVSLWKDGKGHVHLVHQLVATSFLGPKPPGYEINHINGIKTDPRLINLEYVTASENNLHAYRVLKRRRPMAKLQETDIPLVRAMHIQGYSKAAIGRYFRISSSAIRHIISGRRWSHIP